MSSNNESRGRLQERAILMRRNNVDNTNVINLTSNSPPRAEDNVIDLTTIGSSPIFLGTNTNELEEVSSGWTCGACTLVNTETQSNCSICNQPRVPVNNNRDMLSDSSILNSSSYPLQFAISGAVGGAVYGGLDGYLNNRNPITSAMRTGFSGAVQGASFGAAMGIANTVFSNQEHRRNFSRYQRRLRQSNSRWEIDINSMSYEERLHRFGGNKVPAASKSAVNALPVRVLTENDVIKIPRDSLNCAICLDEFSVCNKVKTLQCIHIFHSNCIDKWLSAANTCPVCKYVVA